MHFPVIMIDGVEYAGETMIVALGITADGTKRVLGLRQGATENAAVCVALLEDLQARGLDTSRPMLLVLDGAKALHAAAKRVWGQHAVIQRCQVHKKRNVKAHVPEKHHAELERRQAEAYHETGYEAAKASLESTARWLERINYSSTATASTSTSIPSRTFKMSSVACRSIRRISSMNFFPMSGARRALRRGAGLWHEPVSRRIRNRSA
jgi:transposase-like protein